MLTHRIQRIYTVRGNPREGCCDDNGCATAQKRQQCLQAEHDAIHINAHEPAIPLKGHRIKLKFTERRLRSRNLHAGIEMNAVGYAEGIVTRGQELTQGFPVSRVSHITLSIDCSCFRR